MFNKKKQPAIQSVRSRQPKLTLDSSFRRNNVVISRRQREVAAHQQTVTQRQIDLKRSAARRRIKIKMIVASVLVLFVSFFYRMRVTSVDIQSNASTKLQAADMATYESIILKEYNKATIFSQSWLLDTQALRKNVQAANPEIQMIQFSSATPLKTALHADIRFRKPLFTWRDASRVEQYVDSEGVLFKRNLEPTVNPAKLIQIEDQSGAVLDAGTSVLTGKIITFIGQLHGKLVAAYGGTQTEKVIIPRSTREVQIKMKDLPYIVKFSSNRPIDEQIGELQVLLAHLKNTNRSPAEYIDLRTAHKAFYK